MYGYETHLKKWSSGWTAVTGIGMISTFLAIAFLFLDTNNAVALENAAIDYRRNIPAGHLELHSVVTTTTRDGAQQRRVTKRVAYFDGDQLRVDLEEFYRGQPPPGASSTYWERKSITKDGVLEFTNRVDHAGRPLGVAIVNPEAGVPAEQRTVLDARLLGLSATGSFSAAFRGFVGMLSRPDVSVVEIAETTQEGFPCVQISYSRRSGASGKMWIDLNRGPSIVRILNEGSAVSEEVSCQLILHEASGYWFPSRIQYWHRHKGGKSQHEDLSIDLISLGAALPADTFTFAGLGLEPGREVSPIGYANPVQRIWTGKELVPVDTIEPRAPASTWWLWVLGSVAVIAGLILLLTAYRRRAVI